ncbi:MAG: hypothetical protein JO352_17380, partial [Chloroflexi bacterium]|nr:hypothetical protein [Chloroflexota bacterium]
MRYPAPARHEHAQARTFREQIGDEWRRVQHVIEVVLDEQQLTVAECDEPDVVGKGVDELERRGQCEARLADSAWPNEREQADRRAGRRHQL